MYIEMLVKIENFNETKNKIRLKKKNQGNKIRLS